jgi:hypothetical protein
MASVGVHGPIRLSLAALSIALLPVSAGAQSLAPSSDGALSTLAAMCQPIDDPMARLACYDSFFLLYEPQEADSCLEDQVDAVLRATIVDWFDDGVSDGGECVIGLEVDSVGWVSDRVVIGEGTVLEMLSPCTSTDTSLSIDGRVTVTVDQAVEANVHMMCDTGMLRPVWDGGGIRPIGEAVK